jgi:D-tyrosyl-tRNA(Tyr) deacylase
MRAVIQRVSSASVAVDDKPVGSIGAGLVVFVGVMAGDTERGADALADKIANVRILADGSGRMNLSILDTGGSVLVVSQFTLQADVRRGRRPSFAAAAKPDDAEPLIERVIERLRAHGVVVASGSFGAHMEVAVVNDGPVTIIFDTEM